MQVLFTLEQFDVWECKLEICYFGVGNKFVNTVFVQCEHWILKTLVAASGLF